MVLFIAVGDESRRDLCPVGLRVIYRNEVFEDTRPEKYDAGFLDLTYKLQIFDVGVCSPSETKSVGSTMEEANNLSFVPNPLGSNPTLKILPKRFTVIGDAFWVKASGAQKSHSNIVYRARAEVILIQ